MPIFKPSNISGRTLRASAIHSGFSSIKDKREEEKIEGEGLERVLSDKLDKLIVKPRKKMKNIQFNP